MPVETYNARPPLEHHETRLQFWVLVMSVSGLGRQQVGGGVVIVLCGDTKRVRFLLSKLLLLLQDRPPVPGGVTQIQKEGRVWWDGGGWFNLCGGVDCCSTRGLRG